MIFLQVQLQLGDKIPVCRTRHPVPHMIRRYSQLCLIPVSLGILTVIKMLGYILEV